MNPHPARIVPFNDLYSTLCHEVEVGRVVRKVESLSGLHMFTYSKSCVYDKEWNSVNILARGLILHPETKTVVATPFPKFFNYGELNHIAPFGQHFEAHEKVDGSLIVCFWWGNDWHFTTKGSFNSMQANWAFDWAHLHLNLDCLEKGWTYLFEAVYPENRIVIKYPKPELVLLSAYSDMGYEVPTQSLVKSWGDALGCRTAERMPRCTLDELAEKAKTLPGDHEGWVLRFDDGYRLKIKGAEYLRLHRMLSNLTPLSIWDMLRSGQELITYRQELPEEFWADFDSILTLLLHRRDQLIHDTRVWLQSLVWSPAGKQPLTDKEVGLALVNAPEHIRRFVFPYRKTKGNLLSDPRAKEAVYRAIRPTNNHLAGYVPSSSTQRVLEELS